MMIPFFRPASRAGAVLLAAALSACAGAPTQLKLTMAAGQRLNPDMTGLSMPVQVRVFLLKSPARLDGADYFALSDPDKHALGDDVVSTQETTLRPGMSTTLTFKLSSEAQFVGVVAGFQKIDSATWHNSIPIPASGKVTASFANDTVALQKAE